MAVRASAAARATRGRVDQRAGVATDRDAAAGAATPPHASFRVRQSASSSAGVVTEDAAGVAAMAAVRSAVAGWFDSHAGMASVFSRMRSKNRPNPTRENPARVQPSQRAAVGVALIVAREP